jgi:hypothetical protein
VTYEIVVSRFLGRILRAFVITLSFVSIRRGFHHLIVISFALFFLFPAINSNFIKLSAIPPIDIGNLQILHRGANTLRLAKERANYRRLVRIF